MKHARGRTLMPPMVSGESAFTHFFEVLCSAWQVPLVTRTVERELRRSTPRGAQKISKWLLQILCVHGASVGGNLCSGAEWPALCSVVGELPVQDSV